jgi:dethiobiotin synthetase
MTLAMIHGSFPPKPFRMTERLIVVGTGTDVGKTWLSCVLLRRWRQQGFTINVRKPVMSGPSGDDDDAHLLYTAATGRQPSLNDLDEVAPFRFQASLAPDEAAKREGVTLGLDQVVDAGRATGPTLIETAGGIMSPTAADGLVVDAVLAWGGPVVLVAGGYLGTISHTLTALSVLRQRRISVRVVAVMRAHDPSTVAAITARAECPVVSIDQDGVGQAEQLADMLVTNWVSPR